MKSETLEKVSGIIAKVYCPEDTRFFLSEEQRNTPLMDLGFDVMDAIQVVGEIEATLEVDLTHSNEESFLEMTADEIADMVEMMMAPVETQAKVVPSFAKRRF